MNVPAKYQYVTAIVLIAVAFAFGRYSVSPPTVKTTVTTTQQDQTIEDKNTHTKETITETKKPDGTDTTTTIIDQVANDDTTKKDDITQEIQQTVTPPKKNTLNISVLGAEDFSKGLSTPTYGLSVTKSVLGPISISAFGLMNGTIGVGIGLNF